MARFNAELSFAVEDDGPGFDRDPAPFGPGLQNMNDGLALDGSIEIHARPGSGTRVAGRIPMPAEDRADAYTKAL
jgi:signal transduction histidine kinase